MKVSRVLFIGMLAGFTAACADNSFDYATATKDERKAFLDAQGEKFKKRSRFFLKSGGGPQSVSLYMRGFTSKPSSKELVLNIEVKVPYNSQVYLGDLKQESIALCQQYGKGPLYQNGVKLVADMKTTKGMSVTRIVADPRKCDRVLAMAKAKS